MGNGNNLNTENQEKFLNIMPDYSSGDVDLYEKRVGFGRRLGAYLIDLVFFSIILLIVLFVFGLRDIFPSDWSILADPAANKEFSLNMTIFIAPKALILSILYYLPEIIIGSSIGKLILGIRIASADGKKASIGFLAFRFLLKNIGLPFSLLFVLTNVEIFSSLSSWSAFIFIISCFFALSRKKQALHDLIAKSAVFYTEDIVTSNQE